MIEKSPDFFKKSSSILFSLFLLFISVCLIAALPNLLMSGETLGFFPKEYFNSFIDITKKIFNLFNGNVLFFNGEVPFMELVPSLYQYSMTILFSSIIITFVIAFVLSYLYILLPFKFKKLAQNVLSVTEAIPDLFFIFVLQYGVIFLFQSTGIKLFQVYGIQSNVYFTPILCLSIVPVFLLTRMMVTVIDEENEKPYVTFALSKGLSQTEVFFKHIVRNSLLSIAQYFNILYWSMLSSLIIIEFLFQMNGFTFVMQKSLQPEMLAMSFLLIMIPYGILYILAKLFSIILFGRIHYDEE